MPFYPAEFISSIDNSSTHFIAKICRIEIMLLKLKVIYIILLYITKLLVSADKVYKSNECLLYMVRDLCLYTLWKSNPRLQTMHQHYIMVNYINRLLHQVNISKIIHSSQSFYVFPAIKDHLLNTVILLDQQ